MAPETVGIAGLAVMVALILVRVPIGLVLLLVGALGNVALAGVEEAAFQLTSVIWESGTNFLLIALPMFVLMGQLVYQTGIATDLYDTVYKWLGRLPGGVAVASTVTSAGFGAVTGSSFATVHTMGTMVMPEAQKYGYDRRLMAGSIAAAGTLAIMIPPSILLVVYGIFTQTSIGALFIAGIVPGALLTLLFALYIVLRCTVTPRLGPAGPGFSWSARLASLFRLLPTTAIFLLVLGGIYAGWFTPNEAAAIGVAGVLLVALVMGRVRLPVLRDALRETALVSAAIFTILIGGLLMSRFLVQTEITPAIVSAIGDSGLNPYLIMALFVVMYLALGAVLDVLAMLILTLPFVVPIVTGLGFDLVWFGVFVTVMTELALITPPVGLNVYIMHTVAPDLPITGIFRGVLPFVLLGLIFVALLLAFPELALWLPQTMKNG